MLKQDTPLRWASCLIAACFMFSFNSALAQDDSSLSSLFENTLTCLVVEPLLADANVQPLYQQTAEGCTAIIPNDDRASNYFSDASCLQAIDYAPTSLLSHCALLTDPSSLGEGDGLVEQQWTQSPGTRLDLGARSLDGVQQPYLQRSIYRTIESTRGTCQLEMRVYSPAPGVRSQGSLLAFHGGSWSARGFGFFGLELTIPHFIDKGFVVYAPFYRLLGTSEGSDACNDASIVDVVDDAEAALTWVRENAQRFGSAAKPVVFGQSAGAHLAGSLAVNFPEDVAAGVLFYPPTDFTDFALRVREGYYTNSQGLSILDRVIGMSANEADLNVSPIPENSFPIRIVEEGLTLPPIFMLHGMQDDLVEARQPIRLCDALAGRELLPLDQDAPVLSGLSEVLDCGSESELHLIQEGKHALDVCVLDTRIPTDLCPSGSSASRSAVSAAIGVAGEFAVAAHQSSTVPARRSSGGAVSLCLLILGLSCALRRCR